MIMHTTLVHGDCLVAMKNIPDKSVDMILCDLPYEVLHKNNPHAQWDRKIPFDKLWEQYNRVIKDNGAIVLFAQGMFTAELMMSNPKMWRYNLVWDKCRVTGFLNANECQCVATRIYVFSTSLCLHIIRNTQMESQIIQEEMGFTKIPIAVMVNSRQTTKVEPMRVCQEWKAPSPKAKNSHVLLSLLRKNTKALFSTQRRKALLSSNISSRPTPTKAKQSSTTQWAVAVRASQQNCSTATLSALNSTKNISR